MTDTLTLHAPPTPAAPGLVLRPWSTEDVPTLVDVFRDPAMRHWTSAAIENETDASRWIQDQLRGWAAGDRFGFAVLEQRPRSPHPQLVGNVVLKEVTPGSPSAEVGYWTAAHARGRSVAPRALDALTDWAFDAPAAGSLKRLELLHQVDNTASCRVADKSRYRLEGVLPAAPPAFPLEGHLHTRRRDT
ncbi:GNAT family N-acetyltransferase [Streptomyces althioticus]|uniref:GNAT family N-acetyltransferase n=1 Tax=Streptomyces althioticus TaxID=83380 RepID=UPI0036ADF06F